MVSTSLGAFASNRSTTSARRSRSLAASGGRSSFASADQRRACRACCLQQRAEQGRLAPGKLADGSRIAPVEGSDQIGRCRLVQAMALRGGGDQQRHVEIDGEMAHRQGAQRFGRQQDHFCIGLGRIRADQLDTRLAHLALRPQVRALHPQDLSRIGETQRPRLARQPGGGDAGDLQGHIRAHRQHAMRDRIHQAEAALGHGRARAAQQAFFELHQRRLDALIAMAGENGHEPLHRRRFMGGIGRQHILQAGGQQGGFGRARQGNLDDGIAAVTNRTSIVPQQTMSALT